MFDPEIPVNIYDLGLIYNTEINDRGCYNSDESYRAWLSCCRGYARWVSDVAKPVNGIKSVNVEIVWEPQWNGGDE